METAAARKGKKMLHRCEFLRQWHAATGFFYFIEIAVEEEKMKNKKIATRMTIVNYRKFVLVSDEMTKTLATAVRRRRERERVRPLPKN
jgi:hypothetical protein